MQTKKNIKTKAESANTRESKAREHSSGARRMGRPDKETQNGDGNKTRGKQKNTALQHQMMCAVFSVDIKNKMKVV